MPPDKAASYWTNIEMNVQNLYNTMSEEDFVNMFCNVLVVEIMFSVYSQKTTN